jgi:hypothetical protein
VKKKKNRTKNCRMSNHLCWTELVEEQVAESVQVAQDELVVLLEGVERHAAWTGGSEFLGVARALVDVASWLACPNAALVDVAQSLVQHDTCELQQQVAGQCVHAAAAAAVERVVRILVVQQEEHTKLAGLQEP